MARVITKVQIASGDTLYTVSISLVKSGALSFRTTQARKPKGYDATLTVRTVDGVQLSIFPKNKFKIKYVGKEFTIEREFHLNIHEEEV